MWTWLAYGLPSTAPCAFFEMTMRERMGEIVSRRVSGHRLRLVHHGMITPLFL